MILSEAGKKLGVTQIIELMKGTEDRNRQRHIPYAARGCVHPCRPGCTHTKGPPRPQALGCGLNFTTGFPGSPACKGQIVKLSLRDCISQFLITNLLLETEPIAYVRMCVCIKQNREPQLTQIY